MELRVMDQGFKIIYTPEVRIWHQVSANARTNHRQYYYFTRNYIWMAYRDYPLLRGARFLSFKLAMMFYLTLRAGCYPSFARGLWDGLTGLRGIHKDRKPISRATMNHWLNLEKGRPGLLRGWRVTVHGHNCEAMTAESAQKANPAPPLRRGRWIRRWLGAGAYPFLSKWLDPSRQFSQIAYARLLSNLVPTGASWLDAGCGHQVFKISSVHEEAQILSRTNLAVGCDLDWQGLRAHRSLKLRACCDLRRMPFGSETFDIDNSQLCSGTS